MPQSYFGKSFTEEGPSGVLRGGQAPWIPPTSVYGQRTPVTLGNVAAHWKVAGATGATFWNITSNLDTRKFFIL